MSELMRFFAGKRVLITGHTGFKGSWLSTMLLLAGAEVCGYALPPNTEPALFLLLQLDRKMRSEIGDIRDKEHISRIVNNFCPDFIFHLAAQPLVRESYKQPAYTYEVNVMGTVNLLEALRLRGVPCAVVNVTTDKVYRNQEWHWGYRESDILGGFDPYSNSKSCSELVTESYRNCFLRHLGIHVAIARAGNVIGGGDFSEDRIVPDCIRSVLKQETIIIRNKDAIRPWQHVLEPLEGYLMLAKALHEHGESFAESYNFGPEDKECISVGELVELFCTAWGKEAAWQYRPQKDQPHESTFLKLDCSKVKRELGWLPSSDVSAAVARTVAWTKAWQNDEELWQATQDEIKKHTFDFCRQ